MTDKRTKKAIKIALITAGAVLFAYIAFCIADCIRLRKSKVYTEPLITLSITEDPEAGYSYYKGLGYTVRYSIGKHERGEDGIEYIISYGKSAEFTWMGIPIWGWWL